MMNRHSRRRAQALGQAIPVPPAPVRQSEALEQVLAGRYELVMALAPREYVECVSMTPAEALMFWGLSPTLNGHEFRVEDIGAPDIPGRYLRGARKYRVIRK